MAEVVQLTLAQWLLGKSPKKKPEPILTNTGSSFLATPILSINESSYIVAWEYAPTGDFYTMTIRANKVPNILHRNIQRMVMGVKYRRV